MVAWSSLLHHVGVKIVPYTCYEIGHTWSSDCPLAAYMFTEAVFKESIKLYLMFYVISFLVKRKKFTRQNVYKLMASISQSTFFLTSTAFFYMFYTCFVRYLMGEFNTLTASFVPAILCNMTCIPLERSDRTAALSRYVTNAALETAYRMLAYRNILPLIPNGQVILFSCAIALYMYHIRKNGPIEKDILSKILEILFTSPNRSAFSAVTYQVDKENNHRKRIFQTVSWFKSLWTKCRLNVQLSLPKHITCPHSNSCVSSCTYGFLRAFTLAYACQSVLNLVRQMFGKPKHFRRAIFDRRSVDLGLFFGLFTGIYKTVSCSLRWLDNKDSAWHSIPAGFLAGLSMFFYKSSAVAIYVAWRMVELFYEQGVLNGYLRYSQFGTALLYSVSAGILFHAGVVEPHNISPRYYKFLSKVTRGLVDKVNRPLMEALELESSSKFPDFIPSLDKSKMSQAAIDHMKRMFPLF